MGWGMGSEEMKVSKKGEVYLLARLFLDEEWFYVTDVGVGAYSCMKLEVRPNPFWGIRSENSDIFYLFMCVAWESILFQFSSLSAIETFIYQLVETVTPTFHNKIYISSIYT